MKRNTTTHSESAYTKRQRRRAERIILATGVYSPAFRKSVEDALEQFKKGDGTTLRQLFREADEIDRQGEEIGKAIRARMQEALIKRKRKRRISRRQETANELAAIEVTDANRAAINEITQALLLWAGFLLDLNPTFRSRLYTIIADEWTKHVRGNIYHEHDSNDPRERERLGP